HRPHRARHHRLPVDRLRPRRPGATHRGRRRRPHLARSRLLQRRRPHHPGHRGARGALAVPQRVPAARLRPRLTTARPQETTMSRPVPPESGGPTAAPDVPLPRIIRAMAVIERVGNALPHPFWLFWILAAILAGTSAVLAALGASVVSPSDGETVVVR